MSRAKHAPARISPQLKTAIIIPARLAARRLPNKPLAALGGVPLIVRVAQQAGKCPGTAAVLVAADDPVIVEAVRRRGIDAVLTASEHASGTDRVAEVAREVACDLVINLQGDEPFIDPRDLHRLILELAAGDAQIATLSRPIVDPRELDDPSVVKVICDAQRWALDFLRTPIPAVTDGLVGARAHLGVYAYRKAALLRFAAAPVHPREASERLEQLRALGLGINMRVCDAHSGTRGIDTREDLQWARERVARLGERAFPSYG